MIQGLLAEALERHGDEPVLFHGERVLSYSDLDLAAGLLADRIRDGAGDIDLPGTRVAVIAGNSPVLVAALFAAWRLGAVAVPLSARLREHELSQILADAEPVTVLSVVEHLGFSFTDLLPRLLPALPSVRACMFVDSDGSVLSELRASPADVARYQVPGGRPSGQVPEPLAREIAAILYTSGTTGTPKGALVAHEREVAGPAELASVLALTPEDRVALVIPVSHAFGLTCLLSATSVGAASVLVESTLTLGALLEAIERHGATILHGSPSLFTSLLKARPDALRTIRAGFVGGAPSAPDLQERLDAKGILNLYGLTETGAVACCRPDDPPERRRTTAGRPLRGVEVRTKNGELQIRGPYVAPGYFRRPDETAAAFVEGWFRTGDLAEIEDGYVRISGREKELVHVGGFNVFPAEVEAVLVTHPDVVQAVVVGVADERMGEALRAFVVARPGSALTPAGLLAFARSKMAGYKLPYAIRLVPELPLLPSGKPDRRALQAR